MNIVPLVPTYQPTFGPTEVNKHVEHWVGLHYDEAYL